MRSAENSRSARSRPRAARSARSSASDAARRIPAASASGSSGGTRTAQSPSTSLRPSMRVATIGTPWKSASNGTRPRPSVARRHRQHVEGRDQGGGPRAVADEAHLRALRRVGQRLPLGPVADDSEDGVRELAVHDRGCAAEDVPALLLVQPADAADHEPLAVEPERRARVGVGLGRRQAVQHARGLDAAAPEVALDRLGHGDRAAIPAQRPSRHPLAPARADRAPRGEASRSSGRGGGGWRRAR